MPSQAIPPHMQEGRRTNQKDTAVSGSVLLEWSGYKGMTWAAPELIAAVNVCVGGCSPSRREGAATALSVLSPAPPSSTREAMSIDFVCVILVCCSMFLPGQLSFSLGTKPLFVT